MSTLFAYNNRDWRLCDANRTDMDTKMAENQAVHQRRPLVSGIIWLGLGIFLLLLVNEWIPDIEFSWPIILIVIGAALTIRGLVRR
jgi:hypothetical protein